VGGRAERSSRTRTRHNARTDTGGARTAPGPHVADIVPTRCAHSSTSARCTGRRLSGLPGRNTASAGAEGRATWWTCRETSFLPSLARSLSHSLSLSRTASPLLPPPSLPTPLTFSNTRARTHTRILDDEVDDVDDDVADDVDDGVDTRWPSEYCSVGFSSRRRV
jgi:hypothetical protein